MSNYSEKELTLLESSFFFLFFFLLLYFFFFQIVPSIPCFVGSSSL